MWARVSKLVVMALAGCGPSLDADADVVTHGDDSRDVTSRGQDVTSGAESNGGPSPSTGSGAATDDTSSGPTTDAHTTDETGGTGDREIFECQITTCFGHVYACGDCLDNDGDGLVDAQDPSCWGPCDNNETGWKAQIPGSGPSPCTQVDCYFDQDQGAGNDDCHWSLTCDPLDPYACNYDPRAVIPGTTWTCEEAASMQSPQCAAFCGPLVPNGCDCFGCCEISFAGQTYTVYLGSEGPQFDWEGTCGPDTVADPSQCAPCTQVTACLNPCDPEGCEICMGQTKPPEGCAQAGCPLGVQPCLPEHQSGDCPDGMACITGCCTPFPS
jgi:hypothetical protein